MLLSILGTASIFLTFAMFMSKQAMLGFPCAIFWAVLGGYCYQESIMTWDMWYFMFFACMGMTIFSAYAAFGLREKRDAIADKEMDEEEAKGKGEKYFDEDTNKLDDMFGSDKDNEKPSKHSQAVRSRAEKRRTGDRSDKW